MGRIHNNRQVFHFKAAKQKQKFPRGGGGNAAAADNPILECGLISLINSYLAFSFCHFSKTKLL